MALTPRRVDLLGKAQCDVIRNGSVMTWQHSNLHGEYDFSDEKMLGSVGLVLPENTPRETD
ncbi:MAG: hypothetical protein H6974_01305 [Gammaproteobacteria bacterium]|nr:hypothetical protein [Gammaproteobacteria bacterium]MCP5195422.1 hypothetical protein [Gammaproteobacteria bacterium]